MTPRPIATLLDTRVCSFAARVLLTLPFWGSGLAKLIDFNAGVAGVAFFQLEPALLFNIGVLATQLVGSLLIIFNIATWLGAGALGVFTALTIPVVHHFWSLEGDQAMHAFHTATEHVGMIGGLILVSILSVRR